MFARSLPEPAPVRAVLLRELRSAVGNRYLQVFAALALGCGGAAVWLGESPEAPAFFLLQVALYFVSLFALLIGVSGAQAESEEWPLLFAQPMRRSALVLGKFGTAWGVFGGVLALLFGPALGANGSAGALLLLYVSTLGLAAVFLAIGLWAGFRLADRVQALVLAVGLWVALLFGVDLVALIAAHWVPVQRAPDLWVGLLMLSPADAFRIHALFALGQIPAEAANKTPLAGAWLAHAGLWLGAVAVAWTGLLLASASRRLERAEC